MNTFFIFLHTKFMNKKVEENSTKLKSSEQRVNNLKKELNNNSDVIVRCVNLNSKAF